MTAWARSLGRQWTNVGPRFLPFADAASANLPLGRLLRLSLFQVTVGMAVVLVTGILNRVMIVELGVSAAVVATMVALPIFIAPFRALIGHRSDNHRSLLGWRRVPFIWFGTLLQFGGFAIMPFALIILSGDTTGPLFLGKLSAGLAFFLVGVGMHTTQTAGLALATDLAPEDSRPRVVALLYVMLLVGMVGSALVFGALLADFGQIRLIQVIQGAALATMVLNLVALWKQEARDPSRTARDRVTLGFRDAWHRFSQKRGVRRLLAAVALGTAAFSMQDILLEPYGGQVLKLSVAATTVLTALLAGGTLIGLAIAARTLRRGLDPYRLAAWGALVGVPAFVAVIFSAPLASSLLFQLGTVLIGLGGGMFAVGTLTCVIRLVQGDETGLALGVWGAVQATAAGTAIAAGGFIRDAISSLAAEGALGPALTSPSAGYGVVYHLEVFLLFATLAVIGPLVRSSGSRAGRDTGQRNFGLAALPG